jgi:hypothetical protein
MALFDRTAKHLARGPAVLFPVDPADAMAELVLRYDPAVRVQSDRFAFHNGVRLVGPIEVTPELTGKAGLPAGMAGMAAAYYASVVEQGSRATRPDELKWQDAERLIRGLAARLGGTVHDERPPMKLDLMVSVYSAQPLPVEQVISVIQPFFDDEIIVEGHERVRDAYFLISEQPPPFFVSYWPPRLSASRLGLPPPALGPLRGSQISRWDLDTKFQVATAAREICLRVAEAGLALANRAGGVVIDAYGFPVDHPGELLPR